MPKPETIKSQNLWDYVEIMTKAVFQSGISWKVVDSKWPGIKEGFKDFDIEAVAALSEPELDDLAQDTRVIRNRRNLSAITSNAQRMIERDQEHGGFQQYLSVPTLASRPLFRTFVNSSSSLVTRDHTSSYWSSEKKLLPITNGLSPESPSRLEPRATTDTYGKPNHPKTDDYIN